MPYARTDDGIRIHYETHGSGTPLVLAYGIGGNADLWDVNRDALAARHRLVLWEPRGHARSDSPKDPGCRCPSTTSSCEPARSRSP